jgi:hypothetical protein
MTSFLIFSLLLAGASGEGNGLSFQAQLGYEPALLCMGKDFAAPADPIDIASFFYLSHALSGKVGVETKNGWQIRTIGSLDYSAFYGEPNIEYYEDLWFPVGTDWVCICATLGGETGHSLKFRRGSGSIYLGLEVSGGKLFGNTALWKGADFRRATITSSMLGFQGHIGLSVPLITFGRFSLGLNPMLKGGKIKELKVEGIPDTAWLGPYTLYRWGVALSLTLNYNGGKQQ